MRLHELVDCDLHGPHDPRDTDPDRLGPLDPRLDNPGEDGDTCWTLEDRDDMYGEVWHYDCPGPHYRLWIGAEL